MNVWCISGIICLWAICVCTLALAFACTRDCEREYVCVSKRAVSSLLCLSCAEMKMALKCPFLTRVPLNIMRQHAPALLSMADRCPIVGHALKYSSATGSASDNNNLTTSSDNGSQGKTYFIWSWLNITNAAKVPLSFIIRLYALHFT